MTKVIEINEGVGEALTAAFERAGVTSVEGLLAHGGTTAGRKELAAKVGVSEQRILEWVNRADLMRINGIGSEYSDLLEAAGVDTVKELATLRADNLHAKFEEVNRAQHLVRRVPGPGEIEKWVTEVKELSPLNGGLVEDETSQGTAELLAEAERVFGSRKAAVKWLDSPNRAVGGATPRSLTEGGGDGIREAKAILVRLQHGTYS